MRMSDFSYKIDDEYIRDTRRYLHSHPELSGQEYATAAFIRCELERFGILYRNVDKTGTWARIDGKSEGKSVLLRADIDALPMQEETGLDYASKKQGVMHACGHDFHTAALLGAAKSLSEIRDQFHGTIFLAFQHAEEFGHGSQHFAQIGLTRGYDRAFGVHITPFFPVGSVAINNGADMASCDYFKITVSGKASHITKPHLGINALTAASEIAWKLPGLPTTVLSPLENALVGVGKLQSGSSYNIIAGEAILEGSLRAFSEEIRARLIEKITQTAKSVAESSGAQAEVYFENFTPTLVNDSDAYEEAVSVSSELLGAEHVYQNQSRDFGSDDFAEYLRYEKGVYVHVGVANEQVNSSLPLHSSSLIPDEGALRIAAELHVRYALHILSN